MAKKQIATFLGPNKGLSITAEHAYAFSGIIEITDSETTMLEFDIGSIYLVGTVQFNYVELSSNDMVYNIYLNNQVIQGYLSHQTAGSSEPDNPIPILIPPHTTCKITATNRDSSTPIDNVVSLVARVYR